MASARAHAFLLVRRWGLFALTWLAGCGGDVAPRARGDAALAADARPDGDAAATADATMGLDAWAAPSPLGVSARDVTATPVLSARVADLSFAPLLDAYLLVYTWVPAAEFRTEARVVRIDAAGQPVVSSPVTIDALAPVSPHHSADPSVAAPDVASARPLVVWSDDRLDPAHLEIFGQFLDASPDGAVLSGDPFRISRVDGTSEWLPDVAWTGAGYYVAWGDDRERGVRDPDARVVFGRSVAVDGTLGPELRLGDDALFQTYPQLDRCGDRLLAAWTDYLAPGGPLTIRYRARLLDAASGQAIGGPFTIASDTQVPPDPPAVACDPRDGSWALAWTGIGPPSTKQVHFARVAHDGSVSAERVISSETDGGGAPRLARVGSAGTLVLSWHAQDTTWGWARELDADGAARGATEPLTASAPRLGTFWTAVVGHPSRAEALVAATLDYDRVALTVLRSP